MTAEIVRKNSCDQPFVIRRAFVYSTAPIRKD